MSKLDLAHCYKLTSIDAIDAIDACSLQWLQLSHCKRVASVEAIGAQSALTHLMLADLRAIAGIGFLAKLPALESFIYPGTRVIDGDLSLLAGLGYVHPRPKAAS
ncbi:hypothetical protein [Lysobacter sp. CA199]|uniref:hypothetical protein n=1 Tax=Lysobacter sp. CA199 TaxID=3455608 RepID=UPI003F8D6DE4